MHGFPAASGLPDGSTQLLPPMLRRLQQTLMEHQQPAARGPALGRFLLGLSRKLRTYF